MSNDTEGNKEYLEEYKSLRDETLKRIEISQTIINLNFVAVGGLLLLGNEAKCFDLILLLQPLLSWSFVTSYIANQKVVADIGNYIREALETKVEKLRWATYFRIRNTHSQKNHHFFIYAIFAVTPLISMLLAPLLIFTGNEKVLLNNKDLSFHSNTVLKTIIAVAAIIFDSFMIYRICREIEDLIDYHPNNIHTDLEIVDFITFLNTPGNEENVKSFNLLLETERKFSKIKSLGKRRCKEKIIETFTKTFDKLQEKLPEGKQAVFLETFKNSKILEAQKDRRLK